MPDWMIEIEKRREHGAPRIRFTPSPREALVGDVINWKNKDTERHWPAPIRDGKLQQDGFMLNPIPPGATSDMAFSPDKDSAGKDLEYGCALHPNERGIIRVLQQPPASATSGEAP
jgi:plastocyanin